MTYREILQLYKDGKLDEKKRQEIEADIEKQDAISEYIFDNTSEDIWDEITNYENNLGSENNPESVNNSESENNFRSINNRKDNKKTSIKSADFTKEIQKSIRKAFLRMGVVVGIAVLAIVAFCSFALPKIVDKFYYNPGKIIDQTTDTNQMSLDMQVYTELNMPFSRRDYVDVKSNGFGNYDIYIPQTWYYSRSGLHNVVGNVKRNKITFYDANVFHKLTGNAFDWFQVEGDLTRPVNELIAEQEQDMLDHSEDGEGKICHGFAGGPEGTKETIKNLEDGRLYTAYFTLNQMMSYEDFVKMMEEKEGLGEIWCAVKTNDPFLYNNDSVYFQADNLGFNMNMSASHNMGWDKEKYPELVLWNTSSEETNEEWAEMVDEDVMKTHVISMLRYMEEQKKFCKMMDVQPRAYGEAADFIEKKGLTIYGFTAIVEKKEIEEWFKKEEIYSVAAEDYY